MTNKKKKYKRKKRTCKEREIIHKRIIYIELILIIILLLVLIFVLNYNKKYNTTSKSEISIQYNIKNKNNLNNKKKIGSNSSNLKQNKQNDNKKIKIQTSTNSNNSKFRSLISQKQKKFEKPEKIKKSIVLILDDAGYNKEFEKLLNLPFIINISILPDKPFSKYTLSVIKNSKNLFPMLHLPMEPEKEKFLIDSKKDFLLINDNEFEIENKIKRILKELPVKYANNHTGSLLSQDPEKSLMVLKILKKLGIKFIDSRTSSNSKFLINSKKINFKIFINDGFIDNKNDFNYIKNMFFTFIKDNNSKKYIILIGHVTKTSTIEFVLWLYRSGIYKNYIFLSVKDLFKNF